MAASRHFIFNYVVNGQEQTSLRSRSEDWLLTRSLFCKPSTRPDGATFYGVFANTLSARTMRFNLSARKEFVFRALRFVIDAFLRYLTASPILSALFTDAFSNFALIRVVEDCAAALCWDCFYLHILSRLCGRI